MSGRIDTHLLRLMSERFYLLALVQFITFALELEARAAFAIYSEAYFILKVNINISTFSRARLGYEIPLGREVLSVKRTP